MKSRPSSFGFTLVELMVVIAMIGLLTSIVLASVNAARTTGNNAKRLADIRQYSTAFEEYYGTYHSYPNPGDQSWYCLGNYPSNVCWGGGQTENAALASALSQFIPGLPAGDKVGSWTGYIYSCTKLVSGVCLRVDVRFFLEKPNQTCGGEKVLNPNYQNMGITYCQLLRFGDS